MKTVIGMLLTVMLVGCAGTLPTEQPAPQVLVKNTVTRVTVPEKYLVIPPQPPAIDLATATQKAVAVWLTYTEERIKILEENISAIKLFNSSDASAK